MLPRGRLMRFRLGSAKGRHSRPWFGALDEASQRTYFSQGVMDPKLVDGDDDVENGCK